MIEGLSRGRGGPQAMPGALVGAHRSLSYMCPLTAYFLAVLSCSVRIFWSSLSYMRISWSVIASASACLARFVARRFSAFMMICAFMVSAPFRSGSYLYILHFACHCFSCLVGRFSAYVAGFHAFMAGDWWHCSCIYNYRPCSRACVVRAGAVRS